MNTDPDFAALDFLVLDNTAFVSGFNFHIVVSQNPQIEVYLTPGIHEEALRNTKGSQLLDIAEGQGRLFIRAPSPEAMAKITEAATLTGDIGALSIPDQEIMAICIDLRTDFPDKNLILLSDDYSVQNTCTPLGIPFFAYQKEGIKKGLTWEVYCPSCYTFFPPAKLKEKCTKCGGRLKRRVKKDRPKKKRSKRNKR